MIELGSDVRDVVTGFRGVSVSRIEHLFQSAEIKIQPRELSDAGNPREAVWFEESRVELVDVKSAAQSVA